MAKTVEESQGGYDNLIRQRETLLIEIARVSEDLAKARSVVLSEIDAFARTRTLSLRLSELAKERDALTPQIERLQVQSQQAQV